MDRQLQMSSKIWFYSRCVLVLWRFGNDDDSRQNQSLIYHQSQYIICMGVQYRNKEYTHPLHATLIPCVCVPMRTRAALCMQWSGRTKQYQLGQSTKCVICLTSSLIRIWYVCVSSSSLLLQFPLFGQRVSYESTGNL